MNVESGIAKKIALGFGIAILFPLMIHYGVNSVSPAPRWEDYRAENAYSNDPGKREQGQKEQRLLDQKRKEAEKKYQRDLFCVTTPSGIAAIIIGTVIAIPAVGSGLMFGGIFCLMDGYINYWSELPNFMRFLSLLAAFCVLLFIGFKKIK